MPAPALIRVQLPSPPLGNLPWKPAVEFHDRGPFLAGFRQGLTFLAIHC